MTLSAADLHRRGIEAANSRRFAQARRALTTAASRTDDPDLKARIEGTMAYVLDQTGQHAAAEATTRALLDRDELSASTIALLSGQLGVLLMHAGQLDEADRLLSRAITTLPTRTIESANLLMSRSMVLMQQHELGGCVDDLNTAIAIFEDHGAVDSLARARHNLGYAALLGGDLVTALRLMTASRPVFASTSELATAVSDLDRAEVLRDAGMTAEAEELLSQVAVRFGAQRMRQARGEAEYHLARSLLRHDPAAAEQVAASTVRRFTDLHSEGWAARAVSVHLEARTRARPDSPPAAVEFSDAHAALSRHGFRTEATALRLVAALAGRERMPRISQSAPTPVRLRAQEVRAARAVKAGRSTEAMRAAATGLELLQGWQQSFGALDLQASFAMHGNDLIFAGLTAAARTNDPATIFEWSERARYLSQQAVPVRPPRDPELADDLAELRMLRAELAGSDWTADGRVRALRDRVRDRQWSTTGTGRSRDRMGIDEVAAALDDGTAVLSYVYTGAELLCVVTTAHVARVVAVHWPRIRTALDGLRADLDVAAAVTTGPLSHVVARGLVERLRSLDVDLIRPVIAVIPAMERFVITAPGVLAGVPWAMLSRLSGTPFTLATSVSRWADPARRPSSTTPAVGFATGPRVPRADEEVQHAAAAWRGADRMPDILEGAEATVAAVTELAARTDVLHIAAHGKHTVDNPLFSGFELADGTLFGYDVDLIPRVPATVILSACELGRSSVRWGEEALGMTRVWLHAGADFVIAAPVAVPDDVAGELLSALHTGLSAGVSPADALSQAALDTGHSAPFQCHGDGF